MKSNNRACVRICGFVAAVLLLPAPVLVWAQAVVGYIPVGGSSLAFDPVTNTVYVAARGFCNLKGSCTPAQVNAANVATKIATLVDPDAINPHAVAVNPVTNKTYIADSGSFGMGFVLHNPGKVTVLDGATNTATDILDPNAN